MIKTEMGVIQMTTGEKLQKLRKSNNITQEQLSEILNVSRQSISKWEGDLAFPETDKLIALAKIYNCSVDYLLNIENNQNTPISENSKIEKKPYNKKKLPFLIASSFVAVLTFVFFAFTWGTLTIKSYDSSYMTVTTSLNYNFYQFTFNGLDKNLTAVSLSTFLVSLIIVALCISYYFIDHISLNILIRVFYILKILLLIAMQRWLISDIKIGGAYNVQLAIDITLVVFQIVILFVNGNLKQINISDKTKKNISIISTISVCALFFVFSAFKCVYQIEDINYSTYKCTFIANFYAIMLRFKSAICLLGFVSLIIAILLVALSMIFYFIDNKYLKISIFALNCLLPVIFLICTLCYKFEDLRTHQTGSTRKTFLWFAFAFMVANVLLQIFLLFKDKISKSQVIAK